MRSINQIFFRGLITLMPIVLTMYLLVQMVSFLENSVGSILKTVVPNDFYIPGMGLLGGFILILTMGLILNNLVLFEIVGGIEKKLKSVPFIKAIYSPLRDLMNMFSKTSDQKMKSVVLVQLESGAQVIGLVTRDNFADLPEPLRSNTNLVAVYCPLSYSVGGFTYLVDKSKVTALNIPLERAMSLAITGWVKSGETKSGDASND